MPSRRDIIALGSAATLSRLTGPRGASAAVPARLETRLFNFKDNLAAGEQDRMLASLQALSKASGIDGFMMGRNIVHIPWPTRFEWMYMVQFGPADGSTSPGATFARFQQMRQHLMSLCRDHVVCDLNCPLPAGFADAAGVKIRHTVMFDFKPGATVESQERNIAAIRQMGKLPMVQHYLVEQNSAKIADPTQMQWQVTADFASFADYKAYSEAPVHLAIRKDFTETTAHVTFLDVEL